MLLISGLLLPHDNPWIPSSPQRFVLCAPLRLHLDQAHQGQDQGQRVREAAK